MSQPLEVLKKLIRDQMAPFAGRVEYGNLRLNVSEWDSANGDTTTNIALVYETPGGSTDQINISYNHATGDLSLIDAHEGEIVTRDEATVVQAVVGRIRIIPLKRQETLQAEVRRLIDDGGSTTGVIGHLNRCLSSEFRGGTLTHLELRDAMTYAVKYMQQRSADPRTSRGGGANGDRRPD